MSIGFWQVLIIALIVVLLFGRGKISSLMGEVATGIKSFKKGMSDDSDDAKKLPEDPETAMKDVTPQKDTTRQG